MTISMLNLALVAVPFVAEDVLVDWQLGESLTSVQAPLSIALSITNETPNLLGAVDLDLAVWDAGGVDVTREFTMGTPVLTNLGALDGDPALANLAPGLSATAALTLTPSAAVLAGTYRIGGTLSANLEGELKVLTLTDQVLQLEAVPRLEIEVYTPTRTHGDWSSTPLVFEPAEAFSMGLVIRNTGAGPASALSLASVGPRFAPDAQGKPVFAKALALEVDGVSMPGGFGLQSGELGDLAVGAERRLLWTAEANHEATLLDLPLQLLSNGILQTPASASLHALVHATIAFEPPNVDDGKVDWLIAADPAPIDPLTGQAFTEFATRVIKSDGTQAQLVTHISPALGAPPTPQNLNSAATINSAGGTWHYLRFNDPGGALYDLAQVTRVQKAVYVGGLGVGNPGDVSRVWTTARWMDVTGDGVPDLVRREVHIVDFLATAGTFEYTLGYVPGSSAALSADIQVIHAAQGGTQHLTLNAGPAHAGEIFVLAGSLSGTQPGIPIGSVVVPLNLDNYMLTLLNNPSIQALYHSIGVLNGQGMATAQVPVPPGFKVGLGIAAHHAFITLPLDKPVEFASNPVALFVLP